MSLGKSLWDALAGGKAATEIVPPAVLYTMVQSTQPFSDTVLFVSPSPHTTNWIPIAVLGVWACGLAAIALMRFRSWLRIQATVRASMPIDIPVAVAVRSSPGLLEPGIVGFLSPILILPEGILKNLTPPQLEAVLAHELSHVRRRDNLTAAIHMIVEAVFWFHPLVWWIGARLVEERERACDEAVLSLGSEPRDYADAILNVCKLYAEFPLACVSGIGGSDLKRRIVRIMTELMPNKLGLGRRLMLTAFGIAAVAGPVLFGLVNAPEIRAQSTQTIAAPLPSFEVASIKPNRSADMRFRIVFPPGRFTATGATIKQLMTDAWNIKDFQISGGPSWISSEKYDIEAKEPDSLAEELQKLPFDQRLKQMGLTLQSLLADRFKLKVSHETRELPVYALVVAKNGPKLTLSTVPPLGTSGARSHGGPLVRMQRGQIPEMKATVGALVMVLSQQPELGGRGVLDRTGLEGTYDISLHWSPDQREAAIPSGPGGVSPSADAVPFTDSSGPSLFTALQEQLGLNLELTKGPVDVIVIDHIERPSEN